MLYLCMLMLMTVGLVQAATESWEAHHPQPQDLATIKNLVEVEIKPGVNLIKNGTVLFDCVKQDCGSSVLVCTATADHCYLRCDKGGTCGGVEFYSAARGTTEINCDGTNACVGAFINCGPTLYRGADGFRKYPGYDKENVAGIRNNLLFLRRSYGKCSMWCGRIGCKEAHIECNGNWRQGCHFYAGLTTDAFMEGTIAARLSKYDSFRPEANVMRLYCDGALSCGESVHFSCKKGSNCTCTGECKGVKVSAFELLDIPPTAKCSGKKPKIAQMTPYVMCRQNFECNAYCEKIVCKKCEIVDCNGDDACAGTYSRGIKLGSIHAVGDPKLGMELRCKGDRTCKDLGGITSVSRNLPKHERGFQLQNVDRVTCSGDNSCEGSHFNVTCIKGGCYWECGDNACLYSEIHVDWLRRLTCSAQNTCAYTNLTAGIASNGWGFDCGPNGCYGAIFVLTIHKKVKHLGPISCKGPGGCQNMKLHIITDHPVDIEEVTCAQAKSCWDAKFTSQGPLKWPKDIFCGGRRGPCKGFTINGKPVLKALPTKKAKKAKKSAKIAKVPVRRRLARLFGF